MSCLVRNHSVLWAAAVAVACLAVHARGDEEWQKRRAAVRQELKKLSNAELEDRLFNPRSYCQILWM